VRFGYTGQEVVRQAQARVGRKGDGGGGGEVSRDLMAARALSHPARGGGACNGTWGCEWSAHFRAWMGKPGIRKYANGPNTQKYPRILSPAGAKRRENFRTVQ
jgi:hypothetical protein